MLAKSPVIDANCRTIWDKHGNLLAVKFLQASYKEYRIGRVFIISFSICELLSLYLPVYLKPFKMLPFYLCVVLVCSLFLSTAHSAYRGYGETCGTHLHASSRDTVGEQRQCDKALGLVCVRPPGRCGCMAVNITGIPEPTIWNQTHCVARLNGTCLIIQTIIPGLPFLPNVTRTKELHCGRGAICTGEDSGCECLPDFIPAPDDHFNCLGSTSSQNCMEVSLTIVSLGVLTNFLSNLWWDVTLFSSSIFYFSSFFSEGIFVTIFFIIVRILFFTLVFLIVRYLKG